MNDKLPCILLCPGVHPPQLTDGFVKNIFSDRHSNFLQNLLVFPTQDYPAYSPIHVLEFLHTQLNFPISAAPPLVMIGFSAGVVAAIAAALSWQIQGGKIKALIALDGWGVPLAGDFPIHRLSHDFFTHWSSLLLGGNSESFYAVPAVNHLKLWQEPAKVSGWSITATGNTVRCSAADFITELLLCYG